MTDLAALPDEPMKAGRALDALVAPMMGYRIINEDSRMRPASMSYVKPSEVRPWSTHIELAWEVVAHLNYMERYPEIQWGPTEPNGEKMWRVSLVNPANVDAFAETLPHAICLAALKAVELSPPRVPENKEGK